MKVSKKIIIALFLCTVVFIAGIVFVMSGDVPPADAPDVAIKLENQKKCEVTWIVGVAQSEPTTFWTWQTNECLSRFGYIYTQNLNEIEEFKTELKNGLINDIYSKKVDDVTFQMADLNYVVAHVAEKECSEKHLKNKLKKLNEYVNACFETHSCLDKTMLSDLENFVKEYK